MCDKRQPCRYAHSIGYMDLCYSENGNCIITCGRDGDVRVWAGFDDDDPISHSIGENAFGLQQKNDKLYVANESSIQILTFPEGERDGILTRNSSPVTHMLTVPDSDLMIITLQNMEIRIIDLLTKTITKELKGIDGCPLGIAYCPSDNLLAISSADGFLRIWNLKTENIVKQINCIPKSNSFDSATVLCKSSFLKGRSSSTLLAYPDHRKIVILLTKDWKHLSFFTNDKIDGNFSICSFNKSKSEQLLAASTNVGEIFIWKLSDKSLIHYSKHPSKTSICSMAWSPIKMKEIAFGDTRGQLGIVSLNLNYDSENEEETNITQLQEFLMHNSEMIGEDTKNADKDDEDILEVRSITDLIEDEKNSIVFDKATFQSPFQPSATDPDTVGNRYMTWNAIGIIREMSNMQTSNDDLSSIEIEFHDTTFHHSMNIFNSNQFSMASLSKSAIILASRDTNMFNCTPLESGGKPWSMALDHQEEILCVAATVNYVAIGTDFRLFRVFSTHGTQCGIFCVPGPIVCIAGNSQNSNIFLVAYHDSRDFIKIQRFQEINYKFKIDTLSAPLLANCFLTWLGFTNKSSSPVLVDSADNIRIYNHNINTWVPIINSFKQIPENNTIFVTEIDEIFGVRCILYSKTDILSVNNRNVITELKISLPLLESDSEKSQLEELLLIKGHNSLVFDNETFTENDEKKIAKNVLKLFAIACRSDRESRAYELVQMNLYQNLKSLAAKYANQLGFSKLADKLTESESLSLPTFTINRHKETTIDKSPMKSFENQNEHVSQNETLNDSQVSMFSNCSTPKQPIKQNPFLKKNQVQNNDNQKTKLMSTLLHEKETENVELKSSNKKLSFVEWLTEKQKQTIAKEFPDFTSDQIVVEALKRYKRIFQKRKSDLSEIDDSVKKSKLL